MSARARPILTIDQPHFQVKLHRDLLEVDLKRGVRKELEDMLEKYGDLRDSVGFLFQNVIPLDVLLKDIDAVRTEKKGVKIVIPGRRDIRIPLPAADAQRLIQELNELIPVEKAREFERLKAREAALRQLEEAKAEALRRREIVP